MSMKASRTCRAVNLNLTMLYNADEKMYHGTTRLEKLKNLGKVIIYSCSGYSISNHPEFWKINTFTS